MDSSAAPAVVLDTNVVLDWLLFDDPSVAAVSAAVSAGRVRWLATAAMRDELGRVLLRGLAAARNADADLILARWDRHALVRDSPPPQPLRCADPDDQMFVDLALAGAARWLLSRDRAVLRLARRAAAVSEFITPERWSLDDPRAPVSARPPCA